MEMEVPNDSDPTYYSLRRVFITDTEAIEVSTSGYNLQKSYHWSGSLTVEPHDPDYALWIWILEQRDHLPGLINDEQLSSLRSELLKVQ